jgi:calcineurin-like phosphoesterase
VIICDIHGEATSEKIAFGRALDGLVSAVIGTHTHVQTADEMIFPGGTAFLCDAGMCGPVESVIGSTIQPVVQRFRTSLPGRLSVATGPVKVSGAWVEIDAETGKALQIQRVARIYDPEGL